MIPNGCILPQQMMNPSTRNSCLLILIIQETWEEKQEGGEDQDKTKREGPPTKISGTKVIGYHRAAGSQSLFI